VGGKNQGQEEAFSWWKSRRTPRTGGVRVSPAYTNATLSGPKQQEENNTMTTKFIFPRMAAAKVFPGAVFAVRFFRPQGDPNAN